MNIFAVDENPVTAAQMLGSQHVIKMALETTQILTTSVRWYGAEDDDLPLTKSGTPYRSTHVNHPSCVWARESRANFNWLVEHGIALCDEYEKRYGKVHACLGPIQHLSRLAHFIPEGEQTPFSMAMPDEFKSDNPIESYRAYYRTKTFLHWNHSTPPSWF